MYADLKRASTKIGDWVLVSGGGGGLGHLAIQYAKAMGARVIAGDSRAKERFCKDLGADIFIDFMKFSNGEELIAEVLKPRLEESRWCFAALRVRDLMIKR